MGGILRQSIVLCVNTKLHNIIRHGVVIDIPMNMVIANWSCVSLVHNGDSIHYRVARH